MSRRRFPVKLTVVALAAVTLLAWLPVPDLTRNVLLLGWVFGFYTALGQWAHVEDMKTFRQDVQPRSKQEPLPDEFFDADRIAMQANPQVWDNDVNIPCPQEAA